MKQLNYTVCVLSHVRFCDPMDCRPPGSSLSMGFSRQEYWNGLPFPSPEGLPYPQIEPVSLTPPVLTGGSFTTSPTWKAAAAAAAAAKSL